MNAYVLGIIVFISQIAFVIAVHIEQGINERKSLEKQMARKIALEQMRDAMKKQM